MSTPSVVESSHIQADTLVVSDIGFHSNERTSETIDFETESVDDSVKTETAQSSQRKPGQLKILDDLYGPLKIGPYTITRRGLDALGATIDGQPLTGHNTNFRTPSRSFINALQLSYPEIEKRMKVSTFGDDYRLPSLLFEMSSIRPPAAPPVIREESTVQVDEGGYYKKMTRLLNSAQQLDLRTSYSKKKPPLWISPNVMTGAGLGMQGFGIFMGLRGILDAVKNNDAVEVIYNGVGVGTELGSIAIDVAVTKAGQHMISAANGAMRDFARTRVGIRLGRSGGLVGGILTIPFDVYSAHREFTAASNTTGKEAMDHYVAGSLNVASAAMTVLLGAAAMAGVAQAGPVGLIIGLVMIVGSQIYGAVRMVDEIDDYIELTIWERIRTGLEAFSFFFDIDKDIKDRYEAAKTKAEIEKARVETVNWLAKMSNTILNETHKDTIEAVVHGRFKNRLKKRRVPVERFGVMTMPIVHIPEVVGLDDTIDARDGVTADTPGAVLGTPGKDKGVMWMIGEGKDTIIGDAKKPNTFYYGEGVKDLTGGEKNDKFVAQNAATDIDNNYGITELSKLKGGAGSDTLVLAGKQTFLARDRSYAIDLEAGTLQVYSPRPDPWIDDGQQYSTKAVLDSIENVETHTDGNSIVTGTAEANVITSRGRDKIDAGAGNDTINLLHQGAQASGGPGMDWYYVAIPQGWVTITEDGVDESYISLNWRMDHIEKIELHRHQLHICLNFDFHYGRRSTICIEDVYKKSDNQRVCVNNKIIIVTRDRYRLRLDLPEKIEHDGVVRIKADIIGDGHPEHTTMVYDMVCQVPTNQNTHYYVPRVNKHVQFLTGSNPDSFYGTRIFLDYDSSELTLAHAAFRTVPSIKLNNAADKDKVDVSCKFVFHFGADRWIEIEGVGEYKETTLESALKNIAANVSTHGYMLVFRDGKAHTLILEEQYSTPPQGYKHNVTKSMTCRHFFPIPYLRMDHNAVFELPHTAAVKLDQVPTCILPTLLPAQTAIDTLHGGGGVCLVHLREKRILRIVTPRGMATSADRLNRASTWQLDASHLADSSITLANNTLYVGTAMIFVPEYGPDDIVDDVFVIGPKGVVKRVNLSVDTVDISYLDARYFEPPANAKDSALGEFSAIADMTLEVRNIVMIDGTRGVVKYNMPARKWTVQSTTPQGTTTSRDITYQQLHIVGRCDHMTAGLFKPTLTENTSKVEPEETN
ncbi:calcium-binding protein [Pseudomonas sp. A34-9]|uniref:calcium-binding protein n=1 Tax=Pseudomonas sp. A34-9 TaxID=3034675 RepID=UPI00240E2ABC|nr:calcium-binding protein [Pseudomonas sp. A34-9]